MEAFGLFHIANKLNRQAACLLTVVDSKYEFIDSYNLHINGWAMVKKKWKVWIYK